MKWGRHRRPISQSAVDGHAAAADALSARDPREVLTGEFLFRDGSTARSTFEAGDFAASRAFLAMGQV